jgi:hypothetical protein
MQITNPPQTVPYVTTVGLQRIEVLIIDIGSWDMDTNNVKGVAHGLGADWVKVLDLKVWIRNDADTEWNPLDKYHDTAGAGLVDGGVREITSTEIKLERRTGGDYQFVTYAGAINRGSILIWKLV